MGRNGQSQSDEAMSAILRDKINELLTENANLEREVSRLRASEGSCRVQPGSENTHADIGQAGTQEVKYTEVVPSLHGAPTKSPHKEKTDDTPKNKDIKEKQKRKTKIYDDDDDDDDDDD